jgi:hypothetical protein
VGYRGKQNVRYQARAYIQVLNIERQFSDKVNLKVIEKKFKSYLVYVWNHASNDRVCQLVGVNLLSFSSGDLF